MKDGNNLLRNKEIDYEKLQGVVFTLKDMFSILGLEMVLPVLTDEDKKLYASYLKAKQEKDFTKSDEIRQVLIEKHLI